LGDRLEPAIAKKLLSRLVEMQFITDWGPATECPSSEFYKSDGYWRGPIWAPTTLLLFDGLLRQGQDELALSVAEKFSKLAATSGMAENYDAIEGAPLRDKAFAWASAVYLILAEYVANQTKD
jgi:glycogen debranching enzyme